MSRLAISRAALLVALATVSARAEAQTIGTFTWQTQPYCNVLLLTVIQEGAGYQLVGHDDQCGAAPAPVTGTAIPSGGGVAFGVAVALPSGRTAHLSATISLASLSGTWIDADGNTGPFAFGANDGVSPRPAPAAATQITSTQLAPSIFAGTGGATTVARSDHIHGDQHAVAVSAPSAFYTFTAESQAPTRSVTTSVSGRLDIRFSFGASYTCNPNTDANRGLYLTVDGVAVRSSFMPRLGNIGTWTYNGVLSGVTDAVVPAGAHTIGVGIECNGADVGAWSSMAQLASVVVVVLP
jgi:hypothetical protein